MAATGVVATGAGGGGTSQPASSRVPDRHKAVDAKSRMRMSVDQRGCLGRADEVVLAQSADVVGRKAHHATVVMNAQVGVVVFAVRDERQGVNECHRPMVVIKGEGPAQGMAVLDQIPSGDFRQQ